MLSESDVLEMGEHVVDLKAGLGGDGGVMWSAAK